MADMRSWLKALGLERYADAFTANDVDLDVLPRLDDDDLAKLGVSLGDRKRLLKAIAEQAAVSPADRRSARASHPAEAERRQLTVLFCDLVGSTELASRLDPEDLRDLIRRYHDTCVRTVDSYDGIVSRFLGDGVLAYFGFPVAHEDDAERAVRAGLDMVAAVARLSRPDGPMSARVGIATGLVVVGDMGGIGDPNAVVGATPNLAARLQAEAPPGGVVVAPTTRRLTGEWFVYRALGTRTLKGIPEPLALTQVTGERQVESRFAAIRASRLTPFVGRDQEIGLLFDRWRSAVQGEGQIVLLSGEAGIGKSRIAETLRERIGSDECTRLRYQCSPYHSSSSLYPVIAQLRAAAGISPDDAPARKLDKLEQLVGRPSAPLMAALLSIPAEGRYPPLAFAPEQQKAQTLRSLLDQLFALAERRPVLFLLEDAHWIDPTTRELVDETIGAIAKRRVLIIITARPEFQHAWSPHAHVTDLSLNRLGERQCFELITRMTGGELITDELANTIAARADGVPLFVEELTKSVLEAGPQISLAIPTTLQDSLLARLDRLAAAKEIAQIGAAIGREFSYPLVAEVATISEPMLRLALGQLEAAGLVFRRGDPPDSAYTFKHALVQDAAQSSLLRNRRQELHGRIAKAIEAKHPELVASQPEILALHYSEAGFAEPAARNWLRAGRLAMSRSAMREAVAQLQSGLRVLQGAPAAAERDDLEIDLQIALASASLAARGYGATGTDEAYHRAQDLLQHRREDPRRFAVRYGLFVVRWNRADLRGAEQAALEMLSDAREAGDQTGLCVAHRSLAVAYNPMARFSAAEQHAVEAGSYHDRTAHRDSANRFGHDIGVAALIHVMLARAFQGDTDGASGAEEEAFSLAESLNHASTLCYALQWTAFRYLIDRDMGHAAMHADRVVRIADERALVFWSALGRCWHGAALATTDPERGLKLLDAGIAARNEQQHRMFDPVVLCSRTEALIGCNRPAEAREALDRAADRAAETGERWWDPEIHRIRSRLIRTEGGDNEAARAELACAVEVAEAQGARSFCNRAAA